MQLNAQNANAFHEPRLHAAPLLALREVSKRFGATVALNQVSMEFRTGEIHCILGENGAGKSTVGKIIAGVHEPSEGTLLLSGSAVSFTGIQDSRAQGLAMVFQELSLAPDLSVRANLRLGSKKAGGTFSLLRHHEEATEARAILENLGCQVDVEEPVKNLPVASQQLIEIAKALLQCPNLVVLDEPTAMLGAGEKDRLFGVLRKLRDEGKALVLITHHIDDVIALADRVSVMRNGSLVDSFRMNESIDEDSILERLTGGKLAGAVRDDQKMFDCQETLRIENLRLRDGSPVSVCVRPGEIVGLYGVVGCGAEDIIGALSGARPNRKLRFFLDGQPFSPSNPARAAAQGVSYLPSGRASNGIFTSLSIRENLCLSMLERLGRFGFVSGKAERDVAFQSLQEFGVKYSDMEAPITSLSGGNQQKVLMARAMARAQKVLVLEEPTAGIDVGAKLSLHERVRELARHGVAVLLLSSDMLETIQLCDTVHTVYGGQLVRRYDKPTLADQCEIVSDILGQKTLHH